MSSRADTSERGYVRREVRRWRGGALEILHDAVAEELPIALVYNGTPFAVMMATPNDLDDFATGFSLSERIVESVDEIERIAVEPRLEGIELQISIAPARAEALVGHARELPGRSGCGLCGARTLEDAVRRPRPVSAGPRVVERALRAALARLGDHQALNSATGATHAAAWATLDGDIALVREDVGRHNALDKLIGALVRGGFDPAAGFAVVTSRASYEMVGKAASAGIAFLAAISAPTALAIALAEEAGVTLVGFARRDGHAVYSRPDRLVAEGATQ